MHPTMKSPAALASMQREMEEIFGPPLKNDDEALRALRAKELIEKMRAAEDPTTARSLSDRALIEKIELLAYNWRAP